MWSAPTSFCRTKACWREWFPWEAKFLDRPHDPSAGAGGASVHFRTASLVACVADIVLSDESERSGPRVDQGGLCGFAAIAQKNFDPSTIRVRAKPVASDSATPRFG